MIRKIETMKNEKLSAIDMEGEIPYGLTNDYMFRAVLQSNNEVLKGLICSLLHLKEEEVSAVQIENPIKLGASIEDKEYRLDISIIMNDQTRINLEMQVNNLGNWQNRSLVYLCRSFDDLNHGMNYEDVKPSIHIGILGYTLFRDYPEFYAGYRMMNIKNHHVYSDNFVINVLDLTQIELATKEDQMYGIDVWARLFKAKTWKELKEVASTNKWMKGAVDTMQQLSSDKWVIKRCLDREEYLADQALRERKLAEAEAKLKQQQLEIEEAKQEAEEAKQEAEEAKQEAERLKKILLDMGGTP